MRSNRQSSTTLYRILLYLVVFMCGGWSIFTRCDNAEYNHSQQQSTPDDHGILIVSCVDGNLHGINTENGQLIWQISNPPLVSQSLSKLEFLKDEKRYRLIPSLEGQLYMLEIDGEDNALRALPITADALFSSTFQLSTDSILVGGKDQRVFGFNPFTGEVKYRCGKDGCEQDSSLPSSQERCDLLISRRVSHVVRAVNLNTGLEQWNFSVGQDNVVSLDKDLSFPQHGPLSQAGAVISEACATVQEPLASEWGGIRWAFGVETGDVEAIMMPPFSRLLWKRRLSASLSRAWLLKAGTVRQLALFAGDVRGRIQQVPDEAGCPRRRSLYLGVFNGHMYVQLEDGSARAAPRPQYVSLTGEQDSPHKTVLDSSLAKRHRVSKITRFEVSTRFQGFFRPSIKESGDPVDLSEFVVHNNGHLHPPSAEPLVIRYGSFVFQKMALCCLVMVICHLLFTDVYLPYHLRRHTLQNRTYGTRSVAKQYQESDGLGVIGGTTVLDSTGIPRERRSVSTIGRHGYDDGQTTAAPIKDQYESRYDTDFEHVRCLGRGAFGVVFEARNRVDQYKYAVKRIRVRYSEQARSKMLQEVRAFAHLEHPGIVRYYQAWFELPPPGWQERKDRELDLGRGGDQDGDGGQDCGGSSSWSGGRSSTGTGSATRATSNNSSDEDWSCILDNGTSPDDNSGLIIFDRSALPSSLDSGPSVIGAGAGGSGESVRSRTGVAAGATGTACTHLYLYISMHLYGSRSLKHWLEERQQKRWAVASAAGSTVAAPMAPLLHMFTQIVDAVAYIHSNGLMHRDLKPSNILFDDRGHIRIADFGLATSLLRGKSRPADETGDHGDPVGAVADGPCSLTSNVGTELYMSPEQQKRSDYDQKVDVFALGIIFLELVVPLDTAMERVIVLSRARTNQFESWITSAFPAEIEFASRLLNIDPKMRPTCDEILEDPLLASVVDEMRTRRRSRSGTVD